MSKFEDQLLEDLMREHGPALAAAERPRRRTTKPVWITTGVVALAGAATGAVLLLPTDAPASAVTENGDGTVTVSVDNASAVDAINKELQDKQVPMRLDPNASIKCVSAVDPKRIPQGEPIDIPLDQLVGDGVPTRIKLAKNADGSVTLTVIECAPKPSGTK